jgi:hypothetical protein
MATVATKGQDETALESAVRGTVAALVATYRLGGRTFAAAPALVALAVVPQFAQHAWEIEAGMFASVDAFRALQMDPTRWIFGYAKVAGLLAGFVMIARFWEVGSVRRAILVPPRDLLRFGLVFGATVAVDFLCKQLGQHIPMLKFAAAAANLIVQFGLTFLLVAALLGDRGTSLREAVLHRWVATLFLVALAAGAFGPASLLHKATHTLAFGQ